MTEPSEREREVFAALEMLRHAEPRAMTVWVDDTPRDLTAEEWFAALANPALRMSPEDRAAYEQDARDHGIGMAFVSKDGIARRIDPNRFYSRPTAEGDDNGTSTQD